jgi:hypothetical protein
MTTNVREFGAAGDGRTDDSDAFLKAAAAVNPGGGVLYIPAGVYLLTRNVKVCDRAVMIRGDGIGISRLVWGTNAKSVGLGIVQSRVQGNVTDFTHVTGLSLYTHGANFGTALVVNLSGQANNQAKVVMNRTNPRICIEHVEIRGEDSSQQGWRRAILLDHGHHAVISNVHITGLTRGGAESGIHLDGMGSPTEVQISQSWVFHVGKALHITGKVEGVKLSQCDFVAVQHGVFAEKCLQLNVVNSHINASHGGILARNVNQSSFSNLLIYKNSDACAGFGIQIEGDSGRNIISNNVFVNIAQKADMHAIVLAGNSHHCITANNIFQNHGDGIMCLPGATNCQAAGNVYEHPGLKCKWQQGHPSNRTTDVL